MTSGSSTGVAPPASPVPLPRATNGRPWRAATRTAAATSSPERGKHTTAARPRATPASRAYERELERLGARAVGTERRLQIGEERARVVDDHETTTAVAYARDLMAQASADDGTERTQRRTATTAAAREWVTFADPVDEVAPGRSTSRSCCRRGSASSAAGARASDRADARARARLLLLRRPLLRQGRPRPRGEGGQGAQPPTSGSSPSGAQAGHLREGRARADDEPGPTEWKTRLVDDACIFLNRPDFDAGPGCALHLHALNAASTSASTSPRSAGSCRCAASTTSRTTAP